MEGAEYTHFPTSYKVGGELKIYINQCVKRIDLSLGQKDGPKSVACKRIG